MAIKRELLLDPNPITITKSTENDTIMTPRHSPISEAPPMVGTGDWINILPIIANTCNTSEDDIQDTYLSTATHESLASLSAKSRFMSLSRHTYCLRKGVSFETFSAAWNTIVDSHTILRTRLIQLGAQDVHVVLRNGVKCQKSTNIHTYLKEDYENGMGMGMELLRVGFIEDQNATNHHHFVITAHHVVCDHLPLTLILKNLESAIEKRPQQHGDLFQSAASCLHASHEQSRDFWETELSRMSPTLFPALPPGHYIPQITRSLIHTTKLARWMDHDNLSTTISLSWAILISYYTASEEVAFGLKEPERCSTIAPNNLKTSPMTATLPIQVLVNGEEKIGQAWRELHRRREAMVPHEHFGIKQIRKSSPERPDLCNLQSLIVFQSERPDHISLSRETGHTSEFENQTKTGIYPVTLFVRPSGHSVSIQAFYDDRLVPESQMKRILRQLSHIMNSVHCENTSRVADIQALSPEDQIELQKWHDEMAPRNVEKCVHDLISDVSRSQPNATAIYSWDGEFSYGTLEVLSSGFAAQLLGSNLVGPDTIIPIYFEKSKWVAVAILGVIKAGAAFALLDPATPSLRLTAIYEEMRAPFMVCPPELESSARDLTNSVLVLETTDGYSNGLVYSALQYQPSEVNHSNILYVVYTSGSTGKPKGVVIQHGAFCSSALAYIKTAGMDQYTRALQFASYSFDVSVTDHLATLLCGGTICIPSPEDRLNDIASVINKFNINYADFTPSFLGSLRPEDMPSLRTIAVGGEALSRAVTEIWGSHVRLLNIYGPAECCVLSTIQSQVKLNSDPLNIGFPTGSVCWIADRNDHDRLVPIGTIGELLIGGPIVGRGYLHDPEKTAAAFVDTPGFLNSMQASMQHRRVYKTGDLVQHAPDGSIRFLGRKDMQVKLRGQRIELGEIEYCLNQSLDVAGLLVDVIKPRKSTGLLVAFILREQATAATNSDFLCDPDNDFHSHVLQAEKHLRSQLPGYMIPSMFFQLTQIPTTASGKIDRKRLREYTASLSPGDLQRYVVAKKDKRAPSTANESLIRELVADLIGLKHEAVGMDDTLVSLGGDSITAMRLTALVTAKGQRLTTSEMLANPKLCDIASVLQEGSDRADDIEYQPFSLLRAPYTEEPDHIRQEAIHQCQVPAHSIEDIYPCTTLQEGMMFNSIEKPGTYECRYLYTIPPEMEEAKLQEAWKAVTEANPILRTRMFQSGSRLYQAVIKDDHVVWEKPNDLEGYIAADSERSVDLGDQLVRMAIAPATSKRPRVWVLSFQQSLNDTWTSRQLLEQTAAAYNGERLGLRPFGPFVEYVMSKDNEAKNFWKSEMANLDPRAGAFPVVPADYSPQSGGSLTYPVMNLPAQRKGHTLTSVIRLAIASVISRYTGSLDVVVGITTLGRLISLPGVAALTGPTITSCPMRIRLHPREIVDNALAKIHSTAVRSIEFEHFGLQHIRNISVDTAQACHFQTYVNIFPLDELAAPEPFLWQDESVPAMEFGGFALAISCALERQNKGFTAVASYDDRVISHDEVVSFFSQVEQAVRQIQADSSMTLEQIHVEIPKAGIKEQLLLNSYPRHGDISEPLETFEPTGIYPTKLGSPDSSNQVPLTEEEVKIQLLVATTLELDPETVCMNSNFFGLGGDSMAAMRLVTLARHQGLHLSVKDIISQPVLADILLQISKGAKNRARNEPSDKGEISPGESKNTQDYSKLLASLPVEISKHVTEIHPTNDFQQMTLTQFYPRYICISLPANVDENRLLGACQRLVQHHPLLRSVFATNFEDQNVLQLVLRTLDVQLIRHRNSSDVEDFWAEDSKKVPLFPDGKPAFQVHLLISEKDSQLTLVFRILHAQFDGVSVGVIVDDLAAAYNGQCLRPAATLSEHSRQAIKQRTPEGYALWRDVLEGAEMTSLIDLGLKHDSEAFQKRSAMAMNEKRSPMLLHATNFIPLIKPQYGITMATIAKAAWSLTLAELMKSDGYTSRDRTLERDIVFGQVVHGRGLDLQNEDRIVGPCINIIPVRAHISQGKGKDKAVTSDLLRQIQNQHIETMPFQNLSLEDIIKNCTSWSSSTKFGSFIRFQNIQNEDCIMDGVPCEVEMYSLPNKPSNTANLLVSVTRTGLEVCMTISNEHVSQEQADSIVETFCHFIKDLDSDEKS